MLKNKVFVTGIYGSGKSTFVENYRHMMPQHTFLSFDKLYGYSGRGKRMDLVYLALRELDSFVMDALPLGSSEVDWPNFVDFVREEDCSIVIVKCDIDHWYTHHLKNKACFSDASEVQHKQWFSEFYAGLGATLTRSFPEKVLNYDSLQDTLKAPKT